MSRRSRALATVAVLLALVGTRCTPDAPSTRIVLITLDTLRHDSFFGGPGREPQMPLLAKWAEGGRVYERCYAATSSTQPTHATLFTGLHPWEHGVPRNGAVLVDDQVTLAERLQDAGFTTAAAVSSFPLHRTFGFAQGFHTYHDEFAETGAEAWNRQRVEGARFWSRAEDVTRVALKQIDEARGAKQFFWFHFFDPHDPYGGSTGSSAGLSPNKLLNRGAGTKNMDRVLARALRLYDRDVAYLDEALDRLLGRILGARQRAWSHVVVVSDHGESFGEDGSVGHGKRLTSAQILVPCLVISPRVTAGRTSEPVGTADLAATLLALAESSPSGEGRDLLQPGPGSGPVVGMRRTFLHPFHERRVDGTTVVHDGLKFYLLDGEDLLTGNSRGPLTRNDTDELVPPQEAAQAQELFARFEEALVGREGASIEDDEALEKLRALGYVP